MIDLSGLPLRTKLPPLEPIGSGKSFIESLSGFIARLALELSVSVAILNSELLAKVPNPYADTPLSGNQRKVGHVYIPRGYELNGSHDQARKWVYAVESVTGRKDMHWHTLLPFGGAFLVGLRKRAAWCPVCLEDARSICKPVFEPLLWSVLEVTRCPIHGVRLVSQCRSCSHTFPPYGAYHRSGYCGYCEAWLGYVEADQSESDHANVGSWESNQVASIIPLGVSIDSDHAIAMIRSRLNMYVQVATGSVRHFAKLTGLHEGVIRPWLKADGAVPRVSGLLQIAKRLNVPLATFYNCQEPTSDELSCVQIAARDSGVIKAPRRKRLKSCTNLYGAHGDLAKQITARRRVVAGSTEPRHMDQLRIVMEQNLALDEPDSIEQVALRQGYSRSCVQNKYPQLCAAITAKRAQVLAAWKGRIKNALQVAMQEQPPPSIQDMCRRLQVSKASTLSRHEPALASLVESRYKTHREEQGHELRAALETALRDRPIIPSLQAVARRLQISSVMLRLRLPDLAAQIVKQHKITSKAEARRKYDGACQKVKIAVEEVIALGMYPSFRRVAARIPETVYKRGRRMQEMVKSARLSLGYMR